MADGEEVRARAGLLGGAGSPGTGVVRLRGEHDMSRASHIDRLLGERLGTCDRLYVDLSRVTFMDSSVLSVLARAARHARPRGVAFHVVAPVGSDVHRLLSISGLLGHLGWVDALPETHERPTEAGQTAETDPRDAHERRDGRSLPQQLQQRARDIAEAPASADPRGHEKRSLAP